MINTITGTTTTPAAGTSSTAGRSTTKTTSEPNDRMGKDAFLKLLVAQLKYQNPLSPMDGTQFIAQTAQLTMTEKLEELATLQTSAVAENNKRSAAEMVGRTITYDDGSKVVEGTVTAALMNAGAPILLIGKTEVPLAKVLEVRATVGAPAPAPTSTTTGSTTGSGTTAATTSSPSTSSSTAATSSTSPATPVTAPSTTTTTTATTTTATTSSTTPSTSS